MSPVCQYSDYEHRDLKETNYSDWLRDEVYQIEGDQSLIFYEVTDHTLMNINKIDVTLYRRRLFYAD